MQNNRRVVAHHCARHENGATAKLLLYSDGGQSVMMGQAWLIDPASIKEGDRLPILSCDKCKHKLVCLTEPEIIRHFEPHV